jgi:hypothetical protein
VYKQGCMEQDDMWMEKQLEETQSLKLWYASIRDGSCKNFFIINIDNISQRHYNAWFSHIGPMGNPGMIVYNVMSSLVGHYEESGLDW